MENCFALLAAHEKIAEDLVSQGGVTITRPLIIVPPYFLHARACPIVNVGQL